MNENGNQGAFASSSDIWRQTGLTKREYFAGLAMQSYVNTYYGEQKDTIEDVAKRSVKMADVLLEELDKTKNK
jgi:hypothetical protein